MKASLDRSPVHELASSQSEMHAVNEIFFAAGVEAVAWPVDGNSVARDATDERASRVSLDPKTRELVNLAVGVAAGFSISELQALCAAAAKAGATKSEIDETLGLAGAARDGNSSSFSVPAGTYHPYWIPG